MARRINDEMADYAVQRVEAAIGSLQQQVVLLLGVSYRAEVRETAFSSAHLLAASLHRAGAIVYAHDPLLSDEELREAGFTPLPERAREQVRAIILQTGHAAYADFDFSRFGNCQVVLDGRRALPRERVEASGMRYLAIGDGHMSISDNQIAIGDNPIAIGDSRSRDACHRPVEAPFSPSHSDSTQAMASIAATAESGTPVTRYEGGE